MNIQGIKLIVLATTLAFGLAACEKYDSAEKAGEGLDKAAERAGERMDSASQAMSDQADEAGVVIDDTVITTKVKSAFMAEPGLQSLQISVDTMNGVVTLSGTADSQENSDKAQQLASNTEGVKEVKNQLVVKVEG
ncbi:MAG: transporter [Betaproteobacteria bacterium HGW-Betaproteobacteria-1]|jgi:hyperosmotically inducible protein|nr:MAG: transporter [Betaproteobacteria bacterium HGW-Betaproteobacteria-1]